METTVAPADINARPYFDRPEAARLALRDRITGLGNHAPSPGGDRQIVIAVARGQFGATNQLMAANGFSMVNCGYFPLGSDKPEMELRHDVTIAGVCFPSSNWLYATYKVA